MWPFSKKPSLPSSSLGRMPVTEFADGAAFLEAQCKYGDVKLEAGKGTIALVLDAAKEFGVPVAVKVEADGTQLAMIRVASREGGFVVPAKTPSKDDPLAPGDVVMWVPMQYNKEIAKKMGHDNFGWIGLIRAKIKPTFDANPGSQWNIICKY